MSQVKTKFIEDDAVTDLKLKLRNNQPLRARNAADSADLNVLKVDASDIAQLLRQTQIATVPSSNNDVTNKVYVDGAITAATGAISTPTNAKENLTLNGTDITNQYKDLAQQAKASSLLLSISGIVQVEGSDYSLSVVSTKTRVTFINGLATGGASELISGDVLNAMYVY